MKKTLFLMTILGASLQFNAQTVILNEGFETIPPGANFPTGWTRQSRISTLGTYISSWKAMDMSSTTNAYGFSGTVAYMGVLANDPKDDLMISPDVNLSPGYSYSLTFQAGTMTTAGRSPVNKYAVYVLPAANTFTGSETPVFQETISIGNIAGLKSVDLSSYAGQNVKVYFREFTQTANTYFLVDNIKIIQQSALGTSEAKLNSDIGIHPNPTSDYVQLKSKSKITKAEVFDMIGRKMDTGFNDDKIDVKDLQPGTYMIKMTEGNKTYSQKLIKK